ncbi:LytR/AlgR family response regulator transcription factor [Pendulispora albinea]|uniref:LytTR family DNA-binding domain-containing protein n=1 Tax=Pendulispora albinea TaxID=2741071 RepID=A0ABZ2M788_9BACT
MYTAIVVDDERLARRELKQLLEEGHGDQIRIVGEAATVQEAASLARLHDPDVVFLDVHLAGESGFDLLPLLDRTVTVVFVTAFDRYAIRAFEVNALDYLLKPVAPQRLATTLARLSRPAPAESATAESTTSDALTYEDRLFLRLDDRMVFLRVRDIVAVLAAGDNSVLHLAGGKQARARKSLREWADRLPERDFVRIHRSTMVNLEFVERLEEWSHFTYRVYLRGLAEPLQMSRRWASRVRSRLG